MKQQIVHIALVVDDYDKAIAFYTGQLHFRLVEDTVLSETKRWVLVAPPGSEGCSLLLAKAAGEEQHSRWATRPADGYFCFYTPTIFNAIMMICAVRELSLCGSL